MDPFLIFQPSVITPATEAAFLQNLTLSKTSSLSCPHAPWTQLRSRRLILAGAVPANSQHQAPTTQEQQAHIPSWILDPDLVGAVNSHLPSHVSAFNVSGVACNCHSSTADGDGDGAEGGESGRLNVLINEYEFESPHGGINLHTDGPAFEPAVCIISFASMVPIIFTPIASPEQMEAMRMMMMTQEKTQGSDSLYDDDDQGDSDGDDDDTLSTPEWAVRASLWKKLSACSDLISSKATESSPPSPSRLGSLHDLRLSSPGSTAVLLPPRSLVIFSGIYYAGMMHGILTDHSFVDVLPRSKISNFDQVVASFPPAATMNLAEKVTEEKKQLFSVLQRAVKLATNKRDSTVGELPEELESLRGKWILVANGKEEEQFVVSVRHRLRVSLTYRRVKSE